jgi:DNA-binding transcriptional regulator YiaG
MEAGYHVEQVDLQAERVVFARPVIRYQVRREDQVVQWDAYLVRALRAHMGLSQAEMANVLGVRQQTISEWETGVYTPTRARNKHLMIVAEQSEFEFEALDED